MRKRALGAVLVAALAAAAVPAVAGSASKPTIRIVGETKYKINAYVKDTMRYKAATTTVKSGREITVVNNTREPHTVSFVKKSDLPRTKSQIERCFEDGVCGQFAAAHEVPEDDGPPAKPVVDGGDGFNEAGDSIVIAPKGAGPNAKMAITAPKGRTLHYFCAIHPWMQGKVKVN